MKFSRIRVAAITLVAVIVISLSAWTITSPPVLELQSPADLQGSLFSVSKVFALQNFTDGSGAFSFKFGLDYSSNVSAGAHVQLAVYCALVNEEISSPFTKGVALSLQDGSLLIDGRQDSSVSIVSKTQQNLQIYYFQNPDTDIALGEHNMTTRLILSSVDVDYIGNFQGITQIVALTGLVNITS